MQDIEGTVLDIIARKAGADRAGLTRDTELSGLKLDSIDTVEVIFEIEEAFNISLSFNANRAAMGSDIKTVADVVNLVAQAQTNATKAQAPG
jgi:acyl carrier protein